MLLHAGDHQDNARLVAVWVETALPPAAAAPPCCRRHCWRHCCHQCLSSAPHTSLPLSPGSCCTLQHHPTSITSAPAWAAPAHMCAWRLLGGAPPPELGPVLPPEPVPPSSKERKYIEKVLEESRRVLDADLADFRCVQRSPGFQVFARPVAPSPSGCGSGKGVSQPPARCVAALLLPCGRHSAAAAGLLPHACYCPLAPLATATVPPFFSRPFPPCLAPAPPRVQLTMARLEAEVPVGPDALFELMTSMTGKCIVDPFPKVRAWEPYGREGPGLELSFLHFSTPHPFRPPHRSTTRSWSGPSSSQRATPGWCTARRPASRDCCAPESTSPPTWRPRKSASLCASHARWRRARWRRRECGELRSGWRAGRSLLPSSLVLRIGCA